MTILNIKSHALPDSLVIELNNIVALYSKKNYSAIIPGLNLLQDYNGGYLTKHLISQLSEFLCVPITAVYEIATFYNMYELQPIGRYKVSICNNITCLLQGVDEIIQHIENKLDITTNQTTNDNRISLRYVECLGVCCSAPVMIVNKLLYENLDIIKTNQILDNLK